MKAAKITADNGDTVTAEPSVNGAVVLTVRPDVIARHGVSVQLDEVTAAALAEMIVEARRSALQARAEAVLA